MLDHFREIYYLYADVSCAAYPMTNIDTIMDDGRIDRKSALHYAVYGVTNKYNYIITYILYFYKFMHNIFKGNRQPFKNPRRTPQ